MRLDEYQWSHNPRGLHNSDSPKPINVDRVVRLHCGWVKLVSVDREHIPAIPLLLGNNITPIVRVFRPRFGAGAPTPDMIKAWKEYYQAGVRWFEFYNEPNFEIEWPERETHTFNDLPGTIGPLMQNWLDWAELIIGMGAYPAFPALGEQINSSGDVTLWLISLLQFLSDNAYDRFRNIANSGMWCATHPYFYNHFYQEGAGPLQPRPPEAERAEDGGWHFEYPFDPVTQANSPGLTPVSGGPDFPRGDPLGLSGMGYAFMKKFGEMFGGGAVPVVGTEGGITASPDPQNMQQADNRFPAVSWSSHAEATLAAFNWLAQAGPPWMFGLAVWQENEYFDGPHGALPAVQRLQNAPPIYKSVAPIEALDGPGPGPGGITRIVRPGPGPIHGAPDYHFVVIAPGFNVNWFFSEAREYWAAFRPTVISATDFIAYVPPAKSLAATVLATPDLVDYMTHHIQERWPNVYFDLIVASDVNTIADVLQQRVSSGRRFG